MQKNKNTAILIFLSCVIGVAGAASHATSRAQDVGQPTIAKRIGAIKAINGNVITLAPDSGAEIAVSVQPNARLLRLGSDKDLKNATPVQLSDLQVGDTIRARGQAAPDGKSIAALEIIVITRSAVQAVSDQMRQDWQKRGVGGPVSAVDPAAGTVTISISSLGGKKTMVVRASKNTAIHRYAPDSAKPEDAKPSTLQDIHVGDQLRARGDRSADGGELAAEEIFSGNLPHGLGIDQVGRCKCGNHQRSRCGEQENRAAQNHCRLAASSNSRRNGAAVCHAIKGVDAPRNARRSCELVRKFCPACRSECAARRGVRWLVARFWSNGWRRKSRRRAPRRRVRFPATARPDPRSGAG